MSKPVLRRQLTAFHTFTKKGVWLEMNNYLGHFMDMQLLNLHIIPVDSNPFSSSVISKLKPIKPHIVCKEDDIKTNCTLRPKTFMFISTKFKQFQKPNNCL